MLKQVLDSIINVFMHIYTVVVSLMYLIPPNQLSQILSTCSLLQPVVCSYIACAVFAKQ